jgi:hypothetical protein
MPAQNEPKTEQDTVKITVPSAKSKKKKSERRVWVRHRATLESGCQPVAMPTAPQPEWRWPAVVRDISLGGVSLVLERRFERGAGLRVELPCATDGSVHILTAIVMHIKQRGDRWLLGCEWSIPLTDEELDAYRQGAGDAASG